MTPLWRLLRIVSFSHLTKEWPRLLLNLFGIALGVGVFVAIGIASDTAKRSFRAATEEVVAKDAVRIASPTGPVAEEWVSRLREQYPQLSFVPFSRANAELQCQGASSIPVTLVGVDLFARPAGDGESREMASTREELFKLLASPRAALATSDVAGLKNCNLRTGAAMFPLDELFTGDTSQLKRSLIVDIAYFQHFFETHGFVDEILVTGDDSPEEIRSLLQRGFPPELVVVDREDRVRQAEVMTEAFRLNMQFLSLIALCVSLFLIYNTASGSFLVRRREMGIISTLGSTRGALSLYLLVEAALIGAIGSVLGLALGYGASSYTVRATTATISNIYLPIGATEPVLTAGRTLFSLILGPLVSVLGALIPLREALRSVERDLFAYQTYEARTSRGVAQAAIAGAFFLGVAAVGSHPSLLERDLRFGFIPPAASLLGAVLLVPWCLRTLCSFRTGVFARLFGIESVLAIDHIRSTLRRSAIAVSAIMVSLSLYVGIAVMISSFRSTVERWIIHITRADIYVSSGNRGTLGRVISEEAADSLRSFPGVRDIDYVSEKIVVQDNRRIKVHGLRFSVLAETNRFPLLNPMSSEQLAQALAFERAVLISEPYARRFHLGPGDPITLPGASGEWRGTVANVFYDYSSDQGVILLDEKVFRSVFGEAPKNGVSLYLHEGIDSERMAIELSRAYGAKGLSFIDARSLRSHVLTVFDQTFALTRALQVISLFISLLTVASTLMVLLREREREFGVMRALGASTPSLTRMIRAEAVVLGGTGGVLSIFLGTILAVILVFVVNRHFFAWSIEFALPVETFLMPLAFGFLLAPLAGALPTYNALRQIDAKVLRYE